MFLYISFSFTSPLSENKKKLYLKRGSFKQKERETWKCLHLVIEFENELGVSKLRLESTALKTAGKNSSRPGLHGRPARTH